MGTIWNATVVDRLSIPEEVLKQTIQFRLDDINEKMSTYLPDSELSLFNQYDSVDFYPFSEDTFRVIQTAYQVSQHTDGAFDITIGPLVNLYGFGSETAKSVAPTEEEIQKIKQHVGFELLELNEEQFAVRKKHPKVRCDLSAIAKGYAVDEIARLFDQNRINNYMIEIGGEIRVKGNNPDGEKWAIAIQNSSSQGDYIEEVIHFTDQAIATSGEYKQHRYINGEKISHTINPRTGKPVNHDLASVTILHDECIWADAYATAINVKGVEKGLEFANDNSIKTLIFIHSADGNVYQKSSSPYDRLIE